MGIIYLHATFASNIQPITTIKIFKRNISMSSRPFKTVTLGEKRWFWVFTLSFPFVAIFMFLLHGLLDIYLRDPLLKYLGIIG